MQLNWKAIGLIALVAIGGWLVVKFLAGKLGDVIQAADVKVGVYNFLVCGTMAALFILGLKFLTTKFPIPGLTEAAHAL